MTRRFAIALVVMALSIAAPAALASGEDAQADTTKKQATSEAAPAAPATDDAKKASDSDEAKKQLEEGTFNTLEDLFALLAAPTLPVADTSIEPGNAVEDAPTASGVQWTRVEPTERSD